MSQFTQFLVEVFENFGEITTRKMFGGYGIYHQGIMFGLVADDVLYLKTDKSSEGLFIDEGLKPFEYDKGEKVVKMSYYQAPDVIYDDRQAAANWAKLAFQTAQKAKRS